MVYDLVDKRGLPVYLHISTDSRGYDVSPPPHFMIPFCVSLFVLYLFSSPLHVCSLKPSQL